MECITDFNFKNMLLCSDIANSKQDIYLYNS